MLELRPNCEWCDKDLPPDSDEAYICTYECTYCAHCVEHVLQGVCATCGGGLVKRPIRPKQSYRDGHKLGLGNNPASTLRRHSKWTRDEVDALSRALRDIAPKDR
ncbi:DUF1272 domain-containing protein [Aestuariivita boseongensis]|uniref:DUF1272 domain-containing protein n=1 Tax=Aestuariivita boseongensis TaxID=1470562 RepID=UPI000682DE2F|nr:DUF1272 domain-containing protein [Aestuariivita boseongensis]